jgi:hypothetical protein
MLTKKAAIVGTYGIVMTNTTMEVESEVCGDFQIFGNLFPGASLTFESSQSSGRRIYEVRALLHALLYDVDEAVLGTVST